MTSPGRRALVLNDVQVGIARHAIERWGDPEYLLRLRHAVDAARRADVPVVHVRASFRRGAPEVPPQNRQLHGLVVEKGLCIEGDRSAEIHPDVAPLPDEVVVTKKRTSAFIGGDLDLVLRAQGIDSLVLAGIATSGAVLSTVRAAVDLDYVVTVLADGCADPDHEVHRILTERVFPLQGDVVSIEDWITRIS